MPLPKMLELNRYLQRFGISGWHDPNKGMTKTEDANPWSPGQTASKVTEFLYELVFTFHDSICTWVEEASKGCNEMNISGFSQKERNENLFEFNKRKQSTLPLY